VNLLFNWSFNSVIGKVVVIGIAVSLSVWSIYSATSSVTQEGGQYAFIVSWSAGLFICLYGLIACLCIWRVRTRTLVGYAIADFTYFLGYLCTITAVTALVGRLGYMEDGFLSMKTITVAISVALTTTIAGLVFMNLIRQVQEGQPVTTEVTQKIMEQLQGVISNNRDAFGNLFRECDRTKESLTAMRNEADSLARSMRDCGTGIDRGRTEFPEYAKSVGACVERIDGLSKSIKKLSEYKLPKDVLEALGKTVIGVHDLDEKCQAAGKSVDGFDASVRTCTESVGSMDSQISTNTADMSEFNQAVVELARVLREFARLTELYISRES